MSRQEKLLERAVIYLYIILILKHQ